MEIVVIFHIVISMCAHFSVYIIDVKNVFIFMMRVVPFFIRCCCSFNCSGYSARSFSHLFIHICRKGKRQQREKKKLAVIFVHINDGMCGGLIFQTHQFNLFIIALIERDMQNLKLKHLHCGYYCLTLATQNWNGARARKTAHLRPDFYSQVLFISFT